MDAELLGRNGLLASTLCTFLRQFMYSDILLPQECRDLGIAGRDVDAELRGLDGLVAGQLSAAVGTCTASAVSEAAAYYGAFTGYAHGWDGNVGDASLPSLRALLSGGALPGAGASIVVRA